MLYREASFSDKNRGFTRMVTALSVQSAFLYLFYKQLLDHLCAKCFPTKSLSTRPHGRQSSFSPEAEPIGSYGSSRLACPLTCVRPAAQSSPLACLKRQAASK